MYFSQQLTFLLGFKHWTAQQKYICGITAHSKQNRAENAECWLQQIMKTLYPLYFAKTFLKKSKKNDRIFSPLVQHKQTPADNTLHTDKMTEKNCLVAGSHWKNWQIEVLKVLRLPTCFGCAADRHYCLKMEQQPWCGRATHSKRKVN